MARHAGTRAVKGRFLTSCAEVPFLGREGKYLSLPALERAPDILGPDGPLAATLENFEWRQGQQEMAMAVTHTLRHGGIALVEAGTGTGKSLAYLVPAALFALHSGKRVVISTNTINLQEQLLHKDIPLVQSVMSAELRACLVKGWRNYLCLYRLQSIGQGALELGLEDQMTEIARWAENSLEGSVSELGRLPANWDEVCAESDTCLRSDCPFFQRCFFFRARANMEKAHLLVVNHHLLFADVAVRRAVGWDSDISVLPTYDRVILDEAHHVQDVATNFLSSSLSEYALTRLISRLHRHGSGKARGVLSLVSGRANQCIAEGREIDRADSILRLLEFTVLPGLGETERAGRTFFAAAAQWLGGSSVRRIRPDQREEWLEDVGPAASLFSNATLSLAKALRRLYTESKSVFAQEPGLLREVDALSERCEHIGELADLVRTADNEDEVFWVERTPRRDQVRTVATPLEVGPVLQEWIKNLSALVCTSATLAVARSFAYFRSSLGLLTTEEPRQVHELIIPSPFSYKTQALVGVPQDLPEPTHRGYPVALAEAVGQLVRASRGRAFVLFTSYEMMRQVAARLLPICEEERWPLLVQGEEGRAQMLATFQGSDSVLLGTDSFWEGVDVPGQALSCVIVTRLPFRVPNDPIVEARMEALRARGLDPFYNYSMPEAVLKFKQGFGRLIRSQRDRGAVIVCDRRILARRYGRYFLASLPECEAVSGSLAEVSRAVREWV